MHTLWRLVLFILLTFVWSKSHDVCNNGTRSLHTCTTRSKATYIRSTYTVYKTFTITHPHSKYIKIHAKNKCELRLKRRSIYTGKKENFVHCVSNIQLTHFCKLSYIEIRLRFYLIKNGNITIYDFFIHDFLYVEMWIRHMFQLCK
jgi:hypothetical protein